MWKQWKQTLSRSRSEGSDRHGESARSTSSRRSRRRSLGAPQQHLQSRVWLQTLPEDAVLVILFMLDHVSLHALELTCLIARSSIATLSFWRVSVADRLACFDDPMLPESAQLAHWKRMHCLKQRRSGFSSDTLLTGIVDNDSPNAFSVPPTWLLFKSRCWFWMEKLLLKGSEVEADEASMYVRQLHCGCGYHVPCFWSTGASVSEDAVSKVDFSIRTGCFLSSIHVVPYQAYWIQDHPSFAPKQVSFTLLYQPDQDREGVAWYQSPVYPVTNAMILQKFELPKTVWVSAHSVLRVNLIGRTQRGPIDERPWIPPRNMANEAMGDAGNEQGTHEHYFYCCLSYVNATGFVVQEDTRRARRWWQPSLH